MNIQIEIWKIFENDTLATYAFGDMELFSTRAKGKVVIFKKTGGIYLVEKIDKTTTEKEFNTFYLPRVKRSLQYHRKNKFYPPKTDTSAILVKKKSPKVTTQKKSIDKHNPQKWCDAKITDAIKNKLNKVLISFFHATPEGFSELIGTGFIIFAYGRKALVMTAAHNFEFDGMVQNPKYLNDPAESPQIQVHIGEIFPVDTKKIRAVYKSDNFVDACKIKGVSIVPELDVALCTIEFQKAYKGPAFTYQLGLDSRSPKKGDEVIIVGFSGIKAGEKDASRDKKGKDTAITRKFKVRRGKITGVFNMGVGEVSWPCFETTIPIDAGMDGGPVMPFCITNPVMNGCAIISKDISRKEAFKNFLIPGHSIMAMVWPALLLPFGKDMIKQLDPSENNLLGLINNKIIKDQGKAHINTKIEKMDHHMVTISRKDLLAS